MILSDKPRTVPDAIVIGVPTLGMVSIYWHLQIGALFHQFKPMNRVLVPSVVKGHEVGEARNIIVERALKITEVNVTHVFFIDDDVLISPDALVALLNHGKPIVSGLYYAKNRHEQPLLFTEPHKGAYTDFTFGDVVDCYCHGMGCTLIAADVFRAIEPPWFQTTKGEIDGEDFKQETEDVYFCKKAIEAGFRPCVDTGITAIHYDATADVGYPDWAWKRFTAGNVIPSEVAA